MIEVTHALKPISLDSFEGGQVVAAVLNIDPNNIIEESMKFTFCGRRYSKENVVIIGRNNLELQFGVIIRIIWCRGEAYLLIKVLKTIGFYQDLHSYCFENVTANTNYVCMTFDQLVDFHPLDQVHHSVLDANFVRLRYHVN